MGRFLCITERLLADYYSVQIRLLFQCVLTPNQVKISYNSGGYGLRCLFSDNSGLLFISSGFRAGICRYGERQTALTPMRSIPCLFDIIKFVSFKKLKKVSTSIPCIVLSALAGVCLALPKLTGFPYRALFIWMPPTLPI